MTENRLDRAREFRYIFKCKNEMNVENARMQWNLIEEEFSELKEAVTNKTAADILKEVADLKYVLDQFCAFFDWDIDEAERRIHQSNLTKLDDNGNAIFNEDGKVLKGPNYQPPNLSDLV